MQRGSEPCDSERAFRPGSGGRFAASRLGSESSVSGLIGALPPVRQRMLTDSRSKGLQSARTRVSAIRHQVHPVAVRQLFLARHPPLGERFTALASLKQDVPLGSRDPRPVVRPIDRLQSYVARSPALMDSHRRRRVHATTPANPKPNSMRLDGSGAITRSSYAAPIVRTIGPVMSVGKSLMS
jgi:hypothetical protein